ncbi:carboxypeptidase B-like [Penaeus chinensis]|uniref:carboxypeptidase B-like n=1 Tax=Penaeus chinensis TaxID=139456 RepID=UPI001FB770D1|nr:carboxypeptidase B-like [Penaeus chinensis]
MVSVVPFIIVATVTFTVYGKESTRHELLRGHQIWQLSGDIGAMPLELMQVGLLDVLEHSGTSKKVRVPFQSLEEARRLLQEKGVSHEILVEDLATFLQDGERLSKRSVTEREEYSCSEPRHDSYMAFEEMECFLKRLNESSPRASLTSLGKSCENRDIWMVHLRAEDPQDSEEAGAVWIEGGIHAREWISSAVALHILKELVQDNGNIGQFDVYVVPMANPDGYEYSRNSDRLWRKNRCKTSNPNCAGVDLNRNWDFHYGVGASDIECSEVFRGTEPFSEPETKALRDAMTKLKDQLRLVLSLHSYGQQLLYPWGFSKHEMAPNTEDLIAKGKVFADAAKGAHNKVYEVVNSAGDLYTASGATDDWAKGVLGVKYTYTLELRDEGKFGFILEPSHILPCSEEVWAGLGALLNEILKE